jgi:O-antigen ligase
MMNKYIPIEARSRLISPINEIKSNLIKSSILFYLACAYLVLPIIDIPLLGLSISAPFFFIVALEAIFRSPLPWSKIYRSYITLALLVWMGIFLSAAVNGLLSGGLNVNLQGILTVIRYAYWLLIFNVVVYVVSVGKLFPVVVRIFGWSIFILAILRWGEVLVYGNIGAWTGTHLLLENDYGFQFSTFSPFLLGLTLSEKGWKKIVAGIGTVLLWGAAAINGSRGSWVAIGISVAVLLIILIAAGKRSFLGLTVLLTLIGAVALLIFSSSPQVSQAVENRLNTFQSLNDDKSYGIRLLMNQKSLLLFDHSPLFGIGPGRFSISFVELNIPEGMKYANQEHFNVKTAHNAYMGFLAENGLVGVIPFAILLIILAGAGFRVAIFLLRQDQYWGAMIYSSFIGMSVHLWVFAAFTNTSTWFIYGLVAAMIVFTSAKYGVQIK